jgi:cyclopropane fatty-acyl-phospholipid synthase-like methyltransferase
MKKIIILLLIVGLSACNNKAEQSENQNDSKEVNAEEHNHQKTHKHKHQHAHSANDYMHQSSTEELIERFESKGRDEYQQPEKVLDYLGDLSGKTIMDIGSGSGYFSVKLAKKAQKVIAADVDQTFLDYIQNRIEKDEINNIELRKIPYDSPALKSREVDMVFIVNTYHHIENREAYFGKVKEGLKTDGELVIIDFFKKEIPVGPPADHKIAKDQVLEELKKTGFTSFEVNDELLPYQFIIKAKG